MKGQSKIYTIVGNRPQFIKIDPDLPNQYIIHTGQHYDYEMSQVFFKELKLKKPYINLGCKSENSGRMMDKLIKIFIKDKPSLILLYGDTNSTLMGALAGAYCNIPIAHVEAGARSGDITMPEEINRVIVDRLASVKFACTRECFKNLYEEKILTKKDVYLHGDPMFDAMNKFMPLDKTKDSGQYILLTIHRGFNVDDKNKLNGILHALGETDEQYKFPVHPRTLKNIQKSKLPKNIKLMSPVGYKEMLTLESNAKKIVTDSGGVQREAYWMMIPCIVLRDTTEWKHIIEDGWGVLVGSDSAKIINAVKTFNPITSSKHPEYPRFGVHKKIRDKLALFL